MALMCLVPGCTGDSGGYNTDLAKRLGESATDLRVAVLELGRLPAAPPQFSPEQEANAVAIFSGDFEGISPADLGELEAVARRALRVTTRGLKAARATTRDLRSAGIDLQDPDVKASAEVRGFVESYNALVKTAVSEAGRYERGLRAGVRSNRALVRALAVLYRGLETGEPDGVAQTMRRAARSINDLARLDVSTRDDPPLPKVLNDAAAPLVADANSSEDVSDLVELLQKRYPDSILADILVAGQRP